MLATPMGFHIHQIQMHIIAANGALHLLWSIARIKNI